MSGFGDCSLFEVDMGSRVRREWEFPIVFECCFGEELWGKGVFGGMLVVAPRLCCVWG